LKTLILKIGLPQQKNAFEVKVKKTPISESVKRSSKGEVTSKWIKYDVILFPMTIFDMVEKYENQLCEKCRAMPKTKTRGNEKGFLPQGSKTQIDKRAPFKGRNVPRAPV
jgi:hypothetical protein